VGVRPGYRRVTLIMSNLDWATIQYLKILTGARSQRVVLLAGVNALFQAGERQRQVRKTEPQTTPSFAARGVRIDPQPQQARMYRPA
jgi:hypothetical protein